MLFQSHFEDVYLGTAKTKQVIDPAIQAGEWQGSVFVQFNKMAPLSSIVLWLLHRLTTFVVICRFHELLHR